MTLQETCDEYYDIVYHRCLYELYFNEELAQETAQQVFLILCEKWTQLRDHPNLSGWLLRTTAYKIQKAKASYTKSLATLSIDDEDFIEPVQRNDFYEQIVCERLEENLTRYTGEVCAHLNEKERVLLGYIREKKKYEEIARLMGSTQGAISMAAVRLFRKVRGIVKEIVGDVL